MTSLCALVRSSAHLLDRRDCGTGASSTVGLASVRQVTSLAAWERDTEDASDQGPAPIDGLVLDATDMTDAIMRGDLAAARMYAHLIGIKGECLGMFATATSARQVPVCLGAPATGVRPGFGCDSGHRTSSGAVRHGRIATQIYLRPRTDGAPSAGAIPSRRGEETCGVPSSCANHGFARTIRCGLHAHVDGSAGIFDPQSDHGNRQKAPPSRGVQNSGEPAFPNSWFDLPWTQRDEHVH